MREIKFRVFHKSRMHYFNDDFYHTDGKRIYKLDPHIKDNRYFIMPIPSDDYEIMQYTGLKDMKGKEIYDGDIFKRTDTNDTFLVIWVRDCWIARKIHDNWVNKNVIKYKKDGSLHFMATFKIEIIGNIHENPELL